jgi:uncharacterized protein DUF6174
MTLKRISLVFLSLAVYGIVIFLVYLWVKEPAPFPEVTPTELDQPNYEFTPEYRPANFESELKKNQANWEGRQISHYTISVDLSGMNYDRTPWIVEVKADDVVSIVDSNGTVLSPSEIGNYESVSKQFFNVPALFSFVEQTYQDQPPILKVEYDSIYGYPKSIYVDPWVEPCCQDYWIAVGDLRILP